MAKRNRFDDESVSEETQTGATGNTVEETQTGTIETNEEKVGESTTKKLEDMTDSELIAYMNKRKAEQAAKYAIKEAKLPMHVLVQKSATMPTYTDKEMQMRNRINRLQRQISEGK